MPKEINFELYKSMNVHYQHKRMEALKVPTTLAPSRSAEILPKFTATNVYSYLQDNALPLQHSPYNSLSYRSNLSHVSPKQVFVQAVPSRQNQNYFVGAQRLNIPIANQTLSNRSFEVTRTGKTMKDEQLQVSERKVNTSSQTVTRVQHSKLIQNTPNVHSQPTQTNAIVQFDCSTQTEGFMVAPSDIPFSVKSSMNNMAVPSIFRYGRQQTQEDDREPRQVVSMAPQSSYQPETLMQLVFLNDPHAFAEIESLKQFKSVQNLLGSLSETIDEELSDLDPSAFVEQQSEVNGRVRLTLRLCQEVLNKVLEAIDEKGNSQFMQQTQPDRQSSAAQSVQEYKAPWDAKENSITELSADNSPFEHHRGQKVQFFQAQSTLASQKQQNKPKQPLTVVIGKNTEDNLRMLIEEAKRADVSNPLDQLSSQSQSQNDFY